MTEYIHENQNGTDLDIELLGLANIQPQSSDSSPRKIMVLGHLSQRLTIEGAEPRLIQTPIDRNYAKCTHSIKAPEDIVILYIIPRYKKSISRSDIPENPDVTIIYKEVETGIIGHLIVPYYHSYHQHFGFKYKRTTAFDLLYVGEYVKKDTVFADTPSNIDGSLGFGVNLNTAMMTHPAVADDGIMICEDVLEKLKFKMFERGAVSFGSKQMPINLYGTPDKFKPFPEIGEYIHDSGAFMVLRDFDIDTFPVDFNKDALCEYDFMFDKPVFIKGPGGKVVDIKVITNNNNKPGLLSGMGELLTKYETGLETYYKELLSIEAELRRSNMHLYRNENIHLDPAFHRLLVEANSFVITKDTTVNSRGGSRVKKLYRGDMIDEYRVEYVIEYTVTPDIGFKLTALFGDKGVICRIEKPENMPVDKSGRRADIVVSDTATVNRMNVNRNYEQYIYQVIDDTTITIRRQLNTGKISYKKAHAHISKMDVTHIESTYNFLMEFHKLVNPLFIYRLYMESVHTLDDKIKILASVVATSVYCYSDVYNKYSLQDIVNNLERSIYRPMYDSVEYVDLKNNRVTTKEKVRIGPMHYVLLEKIGDDGLSISSAPLNPFNVISKPNAFVKHRTPWNAKATKTQGETELRVYASYMPEEATVELIDRAGNPDTHRKIYQEILNAERPTNIEQLIDRDDKNAQNYIEYGNTTSLKILRHESEAMGIKLSYVPDGEYE